MTARRLSPEELADMKRHYAEVEGDEALLLDHIEALEAELADKENRLNWLHDFRERSEPTTRAVVKQAREAETERDRLRAENARLRETLVGLIEEIDLHPFRCKHDVMQPNSCLTDVLQAGIRARAALPCGERSSASPAGKGGDR